MTIAMNDPSVEMADTSDWGNLGWEDIEEELYGSAREVCVGYVALAGLEFGTRQGESTHSLYDS